MSQDSRRTTNAGSPDTDKKTPSTGNSAPTGNLPRVLATDLDGTLIPLSDNDRNREDLEELRRHLIQREVPLAFVTGRHLEIVEQAIEEHGLPRPAWIICDVGSSVYQGTPETWQESSAYGNHLEEICATMPVGKLRERLVQFDELTLQEEEKQRPFKLSFYVEQTLLEPTAEKVRDWIRQHDAPYSLIESVDPFTGDGLIDLLPRNVSKAYAVEWWRGHCGYETDEIVFAGDSGNDLAALVAGYRSIVVGNADPAVVRRVQEEHSQRQWTDRLYVAEDHATSGVLAGCRFFRLLPSDDDADPSGGGA